MACIVVFLLLQWLTCRSLNCRYFKYYISSTWYIKPLDVCMIDYYLCGKASGYKYVCSDNTTNSAVRKQVYDNTNCSGDIVAIYNVSNPSSTSIKTKPVDCTPSTQNALSLCDYAKHDRYTYCDDTTKLRSNEWWMVATNVCFDVPNAAFDTKYFCNETGIYRCNCHISSGNCIDYVRFSDSIEEPIPSVCDANGNQHGNYCDGLKYNIIETVDAPTIDGSLWTPSPIPIECENYGLAKYIDSVYNYMKSELWNVIDVCVPQIKLDDERKRREVSWIKYCDNNTLYQQYYHGSVCEGDSFETTQVNTYYLQVNCSKDFDYKSICPLREYAIVEQYVSCDTDYDFYSNSFTLLLNQCTIDKTGCNVKFVCDENGKGIYRVSYGSDDDNCLGSVVNSKIEYTNYTCQDDVYGMTAQAFYCNGKWHGKLYSVFYQQDVSTNIPTETTTYNYNTQTKTITDYGSAGNSFAFCKFVWFVMLWYCMMNI